jgi:glycosyltransferase involved in cell wall biosynthesis
MLIVGAGRLTQQKNFGDLLDALACCRRRWECWRALSPARASCGALSSSKIGRPDSGTAYGWRGVEDLPGLLAAGDIFCLPSLYEGLPLVLLEAMAAGLPIVAYAFEGVADVVEDGNAGTTGHAG